MFKEEQNDLQKSERFKLFERAIEVYLKSEDEFKQTELEERYKDLRQAEIIHSARSLLNSSEDAIRIGAPGWSHAKLFYDEENKIFSVQSNGMDEKDFKKWEKFIGKKFEENGLSFSYQK